MKLNSRVHVKTYFIDQLGTIIKMYQRAIVVRLDDGKVVNLSRKDVTVVRGKAK